MVDDRLQVSKLCLEGEVRPVSVGKARAALIVSHHCMMMCYLFTPGAKIGVSPAHLKVVNPRWRTNQRWSLANNGVGKTGTIGGGAKMNLLLHGGYPPLPGNESGFRRE